MGTAVNEKTDDGKSALSVRVPFCAVCAFGLALLHVSPPMLQSGHRFWRASIGSMVIYYTR
jgi:hypothetical protein